MTKSIGCGVGEANAGDAVVLHGRTLAYRDSFLRRATIGDVYPATLVVGELRGEVLSQFGRIRIV